jgi:hypothetical protein
MSLNRLADEGEHGFEREARLKDPSSVSSGRTDRLPQQVNPEIDQDKGQGDVEQPQHEIFGGRTDAGLIFDAIAGLNTKAVAVVKMYLRPRHVGPIDSIEQIVDAMLPLSTVAVATDHDHRAGYRAMGGGAQLEAYGKAYCAERRSSNPATDSMSLIEQKRIAVSEVGDRIVGFGQIDTSGEVQGVYMHLPKIKAHVD